MRHDHPGGADPATELYRAYDADGQLLYIGISLSAIARLQDHRRESGWFGHVARLEIVPYPSRCVAEHEEEKAIRAERPLWNVMHTKPKAAGPGTKKTPAYVTLVSWRDVPEYACFPESRKYKQETT